MPNNIHRDETTGRSYAVYSHGCMPSGPPISPPEDQEGEPDDYRDPPDEGEPCEPMWCPKHW